MLAAGGGPGGECPGNQHPTRQGASLIRTFAFARVCALCVTCLVLIAAPARAATGPVAAYGFNEGTGSAVGDASGTGNNGTTSGTTWDAGGKFGRALSFNGTNASVTVPDSNSLDLTTGMTLEAWVNPNELGGGSWRTAIFKQSTNGMVYSLYAHNGSRPLGQVNILGEQNAVGTAQLPLNAWTHLATTYDGATLRLYVNGTQVASKPQTGRIPASTGPLRIGGNAIWSEWFRGLIDEVRVYSRALSAGEIQADMATPVGSRAAERHHAPDGVADGAARRPGERDRQRHGERERQRRRRRRAVPAGRRGARGRGHVRSLQRDLGHHHRDVRHPHPDRGRP